MKISGKYEYARITAQTVLGLVALLCNPQGHLFASLSVRAEDLVGLQARAEKGDSNAQLSLGTKYALGNGVEQNYKTAMEWYRRAADQGHMRAQYNIGQMYAHGWGVPQNYREALPWYKRAGDQGLAEAQWSVGQMYALGWGVKRNYREALPWFERSAAQGLKEAEFSLGVMYENGFAVTRDYATAARLYRKAAEKGVPDAAYGLSRMYWEGRGEPKNHVLAYAWASIAAAKEMPGALAVREFCGKEMTREQVAAAQLIASKLAANALEADGDPKRTQEQRPNLGTGSGFFISSDGFFVTNHHVIADATRIRVRTSKWGVLPATVVLSDSANDVAILKLDGSFDALPLRGSSKLNVADRVATMGFPNPDLQGNAGKFSSGEIAALTGPGDDPRFLQISVPIQPGNSGGPLVDSSGQVVGIVVAQLNKIGVLKLTGHLPENVNYAVKGTILIGVLESVPGMAGKISHNASPVRQDSVEVAKALEQSCGMVVVER